MEKKKLMYSELTDSVYWIDGNRKQIDVTQQFYQMMLLWINKGNPVKVNWPASRELTAKGKPKFSIEITNIEAPSNPHY